MLLYLAQKQSDGTDLAPGADHTPDTTAGTDHLPEIDFGSVNSVRLFYAGNWYNISSANDVARWSEELSKLSLTEDHVREVSPPFPPGFSFVFTIRIGEEETRFHVLEYGDKNELRIFTDDHVYLVTGVSNSFLRFLIAETERNE